ncbi:MAG: MetQ/NlpA family lipoprotein [Bergeyella sp.]|nr:MetQ/NlpA family lipoprotein [Bergeyella sp.]
MKSLKNLPFFFFALALSCGGSKKNETNTSLKVGVIAGPEFELARTAKKVAKEKYNLEVELVSFNDYVMPNESLNIGDIEVNIFQNIPYLEDQSKKRGYKFAVLGKTFTYPIVGYSKKIKSPTELKEGNTIAIANDPTNGGRALLLLQKNGLLTLKKNIGLFPKLTDIVENPKNLNIIEIEAPQLPRVLDDKSVVIAVINNSFASQNGLEIEKDGVIIEDKESPYVNIVVSREDNKNDERIKNFVKAYQSDEVEKTAKKIFNGGAIKGW